MVFEEMIVEFEVGKGGSTLEEELEDGRLVDGSGGVNLEDDWSTVDLDDLIVVFEVGKGGRILEEELER